MEKQEQVRRVQSVGKEQLPRDETLELRNELIGRSCQLFFRSDPIKFVRAKGQYMYDETGAEFLDCINNVCHVGHCHPHVVKAGQDQMAILNTNSRFLHDNIVLYAKRLTSLLPDPLSVVYFVNSGSEANDLALRLATAHTGSKEVITLDHAYHGHVVSLIDISPYKFNLPGGQGCPPQTHVAPVPDVYRGKYRDIDHPNEEPGVLFANDVKDIVDKLSKEGKKPSAFIAESLQSCGGQIILPKKYLSEVYKHVRGAGGICIADEVQVGFGRVGTHWWAFELQGVIPDIVTIGKPMGNGHPVAAVITTKEIAQSFGKSGIQYFNTYGGNPVSCAIASAVIDVIEDEKLMDKAKDVGEYLLSEARKLMKKHETIGDVRGAGLFVGIELVSNRSKREPNRPAADFVLSKFRAEKVLMQADGPDENVIKMKPPLVFTRENVDRVISILDTVLTDFERNKA